MNACCLFQYATAEEAAQNRDFEVLENYGDIYFDSNGNAVHFLHTWDDGYRLLVRCKRCGALFLLQRSEFHGIEDSYYTDYFAVADREEALKLNAVYGGFTIEQEFTGLRIWSTNDQWIWNKPEG